MGGAAAFATVARICRRVEYADQERGREGAGNFWDLLSGEALPDRSGTKWCGAASGSGGAGASRAVGTRGKARLPTKYRIKLGAKTSSL
jgi:hypothetical protein